MAGPYRWVNLCTTRWRVDHVLVARTPWQRLVGLHTRRVDAVLLPTASVHTMTMSRPIGLVAIGAEGTIIDVRTVPPRRVVIVPGATAVIEMLGDRPLPAIGGAVTVMASS